MAWIAVSPSEAIIEPEIVAVPAGLAANVVRSEINSRYETLDGKVRRAQALQERVAKIQGNGAFFGGEIVAGSGLQAVVSPLAAMVGSWVADDASITLALNASQTNYLWLRQNPNANRAHFTITTTSAPPSTSDGFGLYLLWGTVTTGVSSVSAIDNSRRYCWWTGLASLPSSVYSGEETYIGAGCAAILHDAFLNYGAFANYGTAVVKPFTLT